MIDLSPEAAKLTVVLLVVISVQAVSVTKSCDKSRTILNETQGFIMDGMAMTMNYTQNTHCEWLIVASPDKFITLNFLQAVNVLTT